MFFSVKNVFHGVLTMHTLGTLIIYLQAGGDRRIMVVSQ